MRLDSANRAVPEDEVGEQSTTGSSEKMKGAHVIRRPPFPVPVV
jgi:hypothetical protein